MSAPQVRDEGSAIIQELGDYGGRYAKGTWVYCHDMVVLKRPR